MSNEIPLSQLQERDFYNLGYRTGKKKQVLSLHLQQPAFAQGDEM